MANLRKYSRNYVKQGVYAIFDCVYNSNTGRMHSSIRTFSRTSQLAKSKNLYNDLGITSHATQKEIKQAYFNLSMVYHPDKNKGCKEASTKFRLISEAYEVLGNIRTRRMYDKGIGSFVRRETQTSGTESEIIEQEVEEDAQTKFYKQHMVRSQPPVMADRIAARDFDEWSAKKISESFQRKQSAKHLSREKEEELQSQRERGTQTLVVVLFALLLICINAYYQFKHDSYFDEKLKKSREEKT